MVAIPPNTQFSQITVNETGATQQMAVIVSSFSSVSSAAGPQALYLTQDVNAPDTWLTVAAGQDLLVYADTLYIAGPLKLPQSNVVLVARQFGTVTDTSGNAAAIIVSGQPGAPPQPPPVAPPQAGSGGGASGHGPGGGGDQGSTGTDGDSGAPGNNAGTITIVAANLLPSLALTVSANGGVGGAGQGGGEGGQGGDGGGGTNWSVYSPPQGENNVYCSNGGAAGDGGQGGAGGAGGMGGNGGTVNFVCLSAQPTGVALSAAAGTLGAAGTPGQGGLAGSSGPPGNPGSNGACNSGPTGVTGDQGGVLSASNTAAAGEANWAVVAPAELPNQASAVLPDTVDIGAVWPALCQLQMQEAKALYLAADPVINPAGFTSAATLISWLTTMTAEYAVTPPPTPPGLAASDVTTLANINAQANSLALRLQQCLDYYGNAFNYVPLVSYDFLSNVVTAMQTAYQTVETQADTYYSDLTNQQQMTTQLQSSIAQAGAATAQLSAQQTYVAGLLNALPATISDQSAAVNNQQTVLAADLASLESEILNMSGCGALQNIFTALTMCAQLPAGSPLAAMGIIAGSAGSLVAGAGPSVPIGPSGSVPAECVVDQIGVYGSQVTSLAEGYKQYGSAITSDDPNGAKIILDAQQLQAELSPYLQLGMAQQTLTDLNEYLSLIQTMNNSILNYNSLLAQWGQYTAQIAQSTQQQNTLQAALKNATNPALPALTSYMGTLYSDLRDLCVYQLYLASCAYGFWALATPPSLYTLLGCSDPVDIDATVIAAAQTTLLGDYSTAMQAFGTSASPFPANLGASGLMYDLPASAVAALVAGQDIYVTIPPYVPDQTPPVSSPFGGMANVRLTKARPWITGVTTTNNGQVKVNISHTGAETIVDTSGNPWSFTHDPVNTMFTYAFNQPQDQAAIFQDADLGNGDFDSADNDYASVGPFTTWKISIPNGVINPGLDTSGITAVTIEFQGQSLSFANSLKSRTQPDDPAGRPRSDG
jgi:hypothetical protein